MAVASWNPLKPRYLLGMGVNRPPPIREMEVAKTQIQLYSWENEIMQHNHGEKPKMQRTWDSKGKRKILRKPSNDLYTL
ncbi:hypothetical protein PIB30_060775 [Stylosanthes scabra]|uniref:Uncharacterized protein n=1 Tax=Stylosanthes scabra TaxID=79078 RepID=A0ABU6QL01_9FABA|nr:hypothetical protein [Stylosanthes scabra]